MADYDVSLRKFYSFEFDYTIDILDKVILDMKKYIQYDSKSLEAGGVLIGYKVKGKRQIIINDLSLPHKNDSRSRISFIRKSKSHLIKIKNSKVKNNFCIGNWHTHPTNSPTPSYIDIETWKFELKNCKSSFNYQLYVICGIKEFRLWIGNEKNKEIIELKECKKEKGIYIRGNNDR